MTISGILPAASENISAALRQNIRKEEKAARLQTAEKRYSHDSIHADRAGDNTGTEQEVSGDDPESEGERQGGVSGRNLGPADRNRQLDALLSLPGQFGPAGI